MPKESAVFLVQLSCHDELPAQFGECAIVGLCGNVARNESGMNNMIAGIVKPIGSQIPSFLENHVIGFLKESLCLFRL